MKTLKWIAPCAPLAFLVAAFLGCEPDLGTAPPYFEPMTVSVYAYEDTLPVPCTPHVSTPGFAMVYDRAGRAMRGVAVDLAATPPELGWIEYTDSVLQDTTNDQGRVDFIFYALGEPGNAIITACVGSACDSVSLALAKGPGSVARVVLTLDKDTLWLAPGSHDSVLVTWCRYDTAGIKIPFDTCSSGDGIPGVLVLPGTTGGRFRPFTAADSSGCAHCWWWFSYGEWGEFQIVACSAGFCDTAFVFVASL